MRRRSPIAPRLILRVHPSNFRIEGFTERPALAELVALARRFDLPVIEDLGSGWIGAGAEACRARRRADAARQPRGRRDVVLFSGDKLLGGPQAGIIAGRATLIDAIRRHPLMRALRVDKMTYAALEATLQEYAADARRDDRSGRADAGARTSTRSAGAPRRWPTACAAT